MSIDEVKLAADVRAQESANECRAMLLRSPSGLAAALGLKPNHKFFRRLAGLRGGDLSKKVATDV